MANIETIVGVQQARYRHARSIESLSPLSHQLESFGLQAEGISEVLASQTEFMKSVGPHKSTINRLTVDVVGDKVTSIDENFIYSTLTGTCVAIFNNKIEWTKKNGNWLIKSQLVIQDWAKDSS